MAFLVSLERPKGHRRCGASLTPREKDFSELVTSSRQFSDNKYWVRSGMIETSIAYLRLKSLRIAHITHYKQKATCFIIKLYSKVSVLNLAKAMASGNDNPYAELITDKLLDNLKTARSQTGLLGIDIIISYIKESGTTKLDSMSFFDGLKQDCDNSIKVRIIATLQMGLSQPTAVIDLARKENVEVKIFRKSWPTFHAKGWLFKYQDDKRTAFVGSSNISGSALTTGVEWNIKLMGSKNSGGIKEFEMAFEDYWTSDVQKNPGQPNDGDWRFEGTNSLLTVNHTDPDIKSLLEMTIFNMDGQAMTEKEKMEFKKAQKVIQDLKAHYQQAARPPSKRSQVPRRPQKSSSTDMLSSTQDQNGEEAPDIQPDLSSAIGQRNQENASTQHEIEKQLSEAMRKYRYPWNYGREAKHEQAIEPIHTVLDDAHRSGLLEGILSNNKFDLHFEAIILHCKWGPSFSKGIDRARRNGLVGKLLGYGSNPNIVCRHEGDDMATAIYLAYAEMFMREGGKLFLGGVEDVETISLIKSLLDYGADPNATYPRRGTTLLQFMIPNYSYHSFGDCCLGLYWCRAGLKETLKDLIWQLILCGANPDQEDNQGDKASDCRVIKHMWIVYQSFPSDKWPKQNPKAQDWKPQARKSLSEYKFQDNWWEEFPQDGSNQDQSDRMDTS